jgi:molecular chaperone DnaK
MPIHEPTAAAVVLALNDTSNGKHPVLSFSLSGDTFDVSFLDIDSGMFEGCVTARGYR